MVEALAALPENQRRAIELHHLEGQPLAEMRAATRINQGGGGRTAPPWSQSPARQARGAVRELCSASHHTKMRFRDGELTIPFAGP